MEKVINSESLPIKLWLNDIEDGALKQAKNLANLPFIFKHIAIMPDAHQGYGMPIGGVMATQGVVIPNAVGVDIGCGMCAVQTSLKEIDTEKLKRILGKIRKVIPVGFGKHATKQSFGLIPNYLNDKYKFYFNSNTYVLNDELGNALKSIGTLGGGNHFIELQKGSDGFIWIMIHSGSRNLGFKVAKHYNDLAIELNKKWHTTVPKEHELAFLPINSDEGQAYLSEMKYCVDFALASRQLMMERVQQAMLEVSDKYIVFNLPINIAHNYAAMENHFDTNVMIHRKGATRARTGELGVIPGSQGTASYIVMGKGNKESFRSCSHGAGRKMGRKQAQRELNLEAEQKRLNDMGVIHSIRGVKDLDEASGAYKDISVVMNNQRDLVDIKVKLTPLAVIKG